MALADLPSFLCDHASCERKAAAQCQALIAKYPEYTLLVEPLVALAREELEHFAQVARLMQKRGILARHDQEDPYVKHLLLGLRVRRDERLLDRLLAVGLIEARSFERLMLVAGEIADPELQAFYRQLAKSEAGHCRVFLRLAQQIFGAEETESALRRLAVHEAAAMRQTPWRSAVH